MKSSAILFLTLVVLSYSPTTTRAENPVAEIAGPGRPSCDHVIGLLYKYGMQMHAQLPHVGSVLLGEAVGDLSISQVVMLEPGNSEAGPLIGVTVLNESEREVRAFSVTLVAVFSRIRPWSPNVSQRVRCIGPRESVELRLQLPIESLAMARAGSEELAFRKLVVAIDSFDELMEENESNNLLVIPSGKIPLAVPPAAAETPDVEPHPPAPSAVPSETPADPLSRPKKRVEDLDFENLGIGGSEG